MITLTPQQQNALSLISECIGTKTPVLLTGFAGTGKSTTITELVRSYQDKHITIACPTHKAAAVVAKMLNQTNINLETVTITTIHSALGKKAKRLSGGGFEFTKPSKDIYGILIIDECSMIDAVMFDEINQAASNASIVYVGDPAQLPPVKGNGISPVFASINKRAHLGDIIRQAIDNPIISLSAWIRGKLEASKHVLIPELISYVKSIDSEQSKICVISRGDVASWCADAMKNGMDCRYLAFKNETIDKQISEIRKSVFGGEVSGFVVGEPVCSLSKHGEIINNQECIVTSVGEFIKKHDVVCQQITLDNHHTVIAAVDVIAKQSKQNSYFRNYNKMQAQSKITSDYKQKASLLKQSEEYSAMGWRLADDIADMRPCCASTVHKSQGSTFDVAIVDVIDIMQMSSVSEILQCLYVAVTRPREYLVLVV